jgi:hypothetical protein
MFKSLSRFFLRELWKFISAKRLVPHTVTSIKGLYTFSRIIVCLLNFYIRRRLNFCSLSYMQFFFFTKIENGILKYQKKSDKKSRYR